MEERTNHNREIMRLACLRMAIDILFSGTTVLMTEAEDKQPPSIAEGVIKESNKLFSWIVSTD